MKTNIWGFADKPRDADRLIEFSTERAYNFDEELYDERYKRGLQLDQIERQGQAFAAFCKEYALNTDGPLLEVGCGTGRLTGIVLSSKIFDQMLVTDGSKAFARITRRNLDRLRENGVGDGVELDYGCLVDSDFNSLPKGYFASVSMYAVLHHFVDWRGALRTIRSSLKPGGTVFLSEPAADFMMIGGLLAEMFKYHANAMGITLDDKAQRSLRALANAASLRVSYDIEPKLPQEDKHAFRIDDILREGHLLGFEVTALPNGSFSDPKANAVNFLNVARRRFSVVNGFSDDLMQLMSPFLDATLNYLAQIASSGAGPYFDCLYVLRRVD